MFVLASLAMLSSGPAHAADTGMVSMPKSSVTAGIGGTLAPLLDITVERYLADRHSVVVDMGLVPLLIINAVRFGVGYRGYFTGGPRGGMHLGLQGDANAGLTLFGAWTYYGANATVGGKVIAASGFTFDLRVGAGIYKGGVANGWEQLQPLPVAMITFGGTRRE